MASTLDELTERLFTKFMSKEFYVCKQCGRLTNEMIRMPCDMLYLQDQHNRYVFPHKMVCVSCAKYNFDYLDTMDREKYAYILDQLRSAFKLNEK
jgi:hypothetical protein